jgi:DNA-binding IclR family transcriptional regulator
MNWGRDVGNDNQRYNIRVLDRSLNLLRLLSDGKARTLTDISRELAISNSTVFRILATLAQHHFIHKDESTGEYSLGLSCLEMAGAFLSTVDIRGQALPELERLRDLTSETVHLGLLDKMEVVYLEKLHGLHAIGLMSSRVGGRSPSHCTGLGKAMLAHMDEELVGKHFTEYGFRQFTEATITNLSDFLDELRLIRTRGYAMDEGEHEVGVRCIAVPIFDLNGKAIAAVSISGPTERLDPFADDQRILNAIQESAQAISRLMGYRSGENNG